MAVEVNLVFKDDLERRIYWCYAFLMYKIYFTYFISLNGIKLTFSRSSK